MDGTTDNCELRDSPFFPNLSNVRYVVHVVRLHTTGFDSFVISRAALGGGAGRLLVRYASTLSFEGLGTLSYRPFSTSMLGLNARLDSLNRC